MKSLFSLPLIVLSLFCGEANAKQWQSKNILIIHSYSPSYQWTADLQDGIERALKQSNSHYKLSIEYLDSKRIAHANYYHEFKQYFTAKYRHHRFDAVLVSDDNALELLQGWEENPLKGLPIIAGGINNLEANLDSLTADSHIIFEQDPIDETLELITSIRPNIRTLYYVADRTTTSEYIHQAVVRALGNEPSFALAEIRDLPLSQAAESLQNISSDDAVLLTHYNTETEQGIYYEYNYLAHQFASNSSAPVFVFWEFFITDGVFGGYVHRSTHIGKQMAVALAQFLPIEFHKELNIEHIEQTVVDYQALARFNIEPTHLPSETVYLNQPQSYFKQNWQIISIGLSIFFCMALVIITQGIYIRQKKRINKQNKKIVRLQKRTLKSQKDMIMVLGDAIETRSGETGHHVRRVAQVSALLAKLYGLSSRDVELLEIVSPMHDVGKIAVSESILEKPGKLTEPEWALMQTHTLHGHRLLSSGEGRIFKLAATVAYQHHERWDGKGYPEGLVGEDIHIFARITAVADVFDALLSERCYKKAWTIEQVIELFNQEQGKQFDPQLTALFLQHIDKFIEIRNASPD